MESAPAPFLASEKRNDFKMFICHCIGTVHIIVHVYCINNQCCGTDPHGSGTLPGSGIIVPDPYPAKYERADKNNCYFSLNSVL